MSITTEAERMLYGALEQAQPYDVLSAMRAIEGFRPDMGEDSYRLFLCAEIWAASIRRMRTTTSDHRLLIAHAEAQRDQAYAMLNGSSKSCTAEKEPS